MTSSLAIDPSVVVWSVPESARAQELTTRPLLVLMHGRGSHEHDLFALAAMLPPQFVIAALRAPLELGPGSYSWFPVGEPGRPSSVAADVAVQALFDWLDSMPSAASVSLLGFSQGGAMTLHALRHAPERFTAPVIPAEAIARTAVWLPSHSTLTERHYAGIGHSISREELEDVNTFLNSAGI